jgi:hypothetical protein
MAKDATPVLDFLDVYGNQLKTACTSLYNTSN